MLVGSCPRISGKYLNLILNGAALKQVYTTKYLGVYIDQHLTWNTHVNYVLKRVRGNLYALNRLKPVSSKLLHLLYKAFVLPTFDYCDVVWFPSNAKNIRRLERINSKFVSQSSSVYDSDLNVTLTERRAYHTTMSLKYFIKSPRLTYKDCSLIVLVLQAMLGEILTDFVPTVMTNYGK